VRLRIPASLNLIVRFQMRITLSTLSLIAFAQIAMCQSAPSDVIAESTIRISADGICRVLDSSMPCVDVAQYLLSKHLAKNGHVHIVVDATSKYESVAAALKSLQSTGLKIGFINESHQ
jgi:biopolymer transport protein ExbD